MDDKTTKLKLMRFWLFGTFIIIFAAATVYVGGAVGAGLSILSELNYWLAMLVAALLCVAWYYIYKWYLNRQG